jgi:transketolase
MSQHKHGGEFAHKVAIIGCGPILYEAIQAAVSLEKEGIGVTVINMPQIKPLDVGYLLRVAHDVRAIVTVEEHQITGGLGSAVAEYLSEHYPIRIGRVGVEDRFGQSGKVQELYEEYGLSAKYIAKKVRETLH